MICQNIINYEFFLIAHPAKWRTYTPHTSNTIGLERELEDSLTCENCLPECSYTRYRTQSSETQINLQSIGDALYVKIWNVSK